MTRATHRASRAVNGRATYAYTAWKNMKRRCLNPDHAQWSDYGGRGITVCQRWRESFEAFRDDMGPRPSPKHSLDRVDNNDCYEPRNCRWSTRRVQALNSRKRRTSMAAYRGVRRNGSGYQAYATVNNAFVNLGRYPSEHQAAAARYAKLYVIAQSKATS